MVQVTNNIEERDVIALGSVARDAMRALGLASAAQRDAGLRAVAAKLRDATDNVLRVNALDYEQAREAGRSGAMLDRLMLDETRLAALAKSMETIAEFADPLAATGPVIERPNGLRIQRVAVPLGVIGIVYESRPNVTLDAAALCVKAANAVILRGGSECVRTNTLLADLFADGMREVGLPVEAAQLIPTQDRRAVGWLLAGLAGNVDVVVPRGGRSLIERVQQDARIPVIGHLEGLCHIYVHEGADLEMAESILVNAKLRRTGICGAAETLLIDANIAETAVPRLVAALASANCEVRGDQQVCALAPAALPAQSADWTTEYLDSIIAARVIDNIDAAMEHIAVYGSGHTDCIVSNDQSAADRFLAEVDSAIVMHNASTQFADGGEFGMGAEIGIATGRIHARGPVGAAELTSYKYQVRGTGQIRP